MRCEHGRKVTVVLDLVSAPYWDEGIVRYDQDGEPAPSYFDYCWGTDKSFSDYVEEFCYTRVKGCPECKAVKVEQG